MQAARIFLFLIVLLFLNCTPKIIKKSTSSSDQVVKDSSVIQTNPDSTIVNIESLQPVKKINKLVAKYSSSPCYGKCPEFEILFYENSNYALWRGFSNTDKIGLYEARINTETITLIQEKATNIRFHSFSSSYPKYGNFLEEYPSIIIYVREGEKETEVKHIYDAPDGLATLEAFFLNLCNKLNWEKVLEE